jgi:P-type E1-E2 ATPase
MEFPAHASDIDASGRTAVFAAWEAKVRGIRGVADTLKEEARQVVTELLDMGLEVAMITGENPHTDEAIARGAGDIALISGDAQPNPVVAH